MTLWTAGLIVRLRDIARGSISGLPRASQSKIFNLCNEAASFRRLGLDRASIFLIVRDDSFCDAGHATLNNSDMFCLIALERWVRAVGA